MVAICSSTTIPQRAVKSCYQELGVDGSVREVPDRYEGPTVKGCFLEFDRLNYDLGRSKDLSIHPFPIIYHRLREAFRGDNSFAIGYPRSP